jgi:hypothetical protein
MNNSMQYRIFHSDAAPLVCFSGAALLIMASDRLAHAITVAGALVWVYGFSSLALHIGARIFPQRGRTLLLAFLASFFAGTYLLLIWMLSPLCAMESFFVISLIPLFCMVSGVLKRLETLILEDAFIESCSEALILGTLIAIFALIREPFGFLSLSLPGGAQGSILLFSFKTESFLPIRLIASSAGALLLLGYFLGLYRYFRTQYGLREGHHNDF